MTRRACHLIRHGAGPRDVNVMRHDFQQQRPFVPPAVGTVLHKTTAMIEKDGVAAANF
jgi:hypothetical protein